MEMKLTLDAATEPWGVLVERVEVKDVRVPERLQKAMAAEAEAAREARAKVGRRVIIIQRRRHLPLYLHFSVSQVIAAEGEHKASRALKHAADIITESPGALQLRYLQTLAHIADESNSTIIFPVYLHTIYSIYTHLVSTQCIHNHNTYPVSTLSAQYLKY